MPFSIQTNVNSLIAQENLRVNSNFQSQTIQRLTSGYRINNPATMPPVWPSPTSSATIPPN